MLPMMRLSLAAALLLAAAPFAGAADAAKPKTPGVVPGNRIATIMVSQELINEQLKEHLDTPILKDVSITLDPETDQIDARGIVIIPTDEVKAVHMEKGLDQFHFQVAIKVKATAKGHLILIFPLEQTYFYPVNAKDPEKERVYIPVQFLSLAIGQARGYLTALSGDFTGFDRKTTRLGEQFALVQKQLKEAKDEDEKDALKNQAASLQLQLSAIPIQRKEIEKMAKVLDPLLGFTGDKEINLNEELKARSNSLVVKIKLSQLVPYLVGVELGGVRIVKDTKDGSGMNFLAIDVNAQLEKFEPPIVSSSTAKGAPGAPPSLVIRLNQSFFESEAVVGAEAKELGGKIRNFGLEFKEDGLHAHGRWHIPIFPDIPFGAVLKFVWISPNVFELRVERIKIEHIDMKSLAGLVLDLAKGRLNKSLNGACTFQYISKEEDGSRALRVTINMPLLVPAFPDLNLTGIVTKDRELLMKIGKL
jgi:hypothetical protein